MHVKPTLGSPRGHNGHNEDPFSDVFWGTLLKMTITIITIIIIIIIIIIITNISLIVLILITITIIVKTIISLILSRLRETSDDLGPQEVDLDRGSPVRRSRPFFKLDASNSGLKLSIHMAHRKTNSRSTAEKSPIQPYDGQSDRLTRYAFLSRTALELICSGRQEPNHLNDHHNLKHHHHGNDHDHHDHHYHHGHGHDHQESSWSPL